MTGPKRRRHHSGRRPGGAVRRQSAEHRAYTDQTIVTAIRLVAVAWEIAWALVHEFAPGWPGPGRPL